MEHTCTIRPVTNEHITAEHVTAEHITATERVIARLQAEGWAECSQLADCFCQSMLTEVELSEFVVQELQRAGGNLPLRELHLACLTFSREAHEFIVHPHLREVLQELLLRGRVRQQGNQLVLL